MQQKSPSFIGFQKNPRPLPNRSSDFASPRGLRYTGAAADLAGQPAAATLTQHEARLQDFQLEQIPVPELLDEDGTFRGMETNFPCATKK